VKDHIKVSVVAEWLGIHAVMLHRWVSEYETYGEEAFVGKGNQRSGDAELRKLRKENERLKMENENNLFQTFSLFRVLGKRKPPVCLLRRSQAGG